MVGRTSFSGISSFNLIVRISFIYVYYRINVKNPLIKLKNIFKKGEEAIPPPRQAWGFPCLVYYEEKYRRYQIGKVE